MERVRSPSNSYQTSTSVTDRPGLLATAFDGDPIRAKPVTLVLTLFEQPLSGMTLSQRPLRARAERFQGVPLGDGHP